MLPLLLSAVLIALVRRDYMGLGLSIGIAVVLACAFLVLAPSRWFEQIWTPEERDEVIERWERIPVLGMIIRFGEWRRRKVAGQSRQSIARKSVDGGQRTKEPTQDRDGDQNTPR
jgi:hypothetical protein